MHKFFSYGPVDCRKHFSAPRQQLVTQCVEQLCGDPEEGGHFFTIWAPRQTGKTWLMRQAFLQIESLYPDQFSILSISLGVLRGIEFSKNDDLDEVPVAFADILSEKLPHRPHPKRWVDFRQLFSRKEGLWDKPLILFIDEVDTMPSPALDVLVGQFREMYLDRPKYLRANWLHGLAMIGVRAVLGVDSDRGSPFNIQRSLHVPNFTVEETADLFRQYVEESGQTITPEVIRAVYDVTRGQPGLVCWFGELLTEKYNPGTAHVIDRVHWSDVYQCAMNVEWNNTVLNLIAKVRNNHTDHVIELFTHADVRFSLDAPWCSFLYTHGVIDFDTVKDEKNRTALVCRFSSPFIQERIYNALTADLVNHTSRVLALEPFDDLSDVFHETGLQLSALLSRYRDYIGRLKAAGLNPWADQPRRSDLRLTEAVGHFHLYAWLQDALGRRCVVQPEFPTGNGKVDLHLSCNDRSGIIEVKSFRDQYQLQLSRVQAARYARQTGLSQVTLAVFVPLMDKTVLDRLSGEFTIDEVTVHVVAIGWE